MGHVLAELGHELAYYADVVEVGLDAVVRASADRYLELVRQAHLTVALVEALVYLLRDGEAVYEAVLAGRPLARDDGAHLRAGAARFEAGLRDEGAEVLYLVEWHALALDRLARRERHYAVAVELRRLGEAGRLLRRYLPVDGDDARREVVGPLVPQKSERFYGFFLRSCYNSVFHSFSPFLFFRLYFAEGMSAFEHLRRREAEGL